MHIIKRIINVIVVFVNLIVSLGLVASAYCGYISPLQWQYAPLAVMTFGAWLVAILALFVIDLLWWKRTALIPGIAMILCSQQIWDFTPLNLPKLGMSESQREHSFSLMTYNVMQFCNQDKERTLYSNEQLDYILAESPDIVCIEEARCFRSDALSSITSEQLQDLSDTYRYIYIKGEDLGLLSKFDTTPIALGDEGKFENGGIGAWRLNIDGEILNLFVVHLLSYRLNISEKGLFEEATSIESTNRETIREAKADILPKVTEALQKRESQIERLIKVIAKYGGKNVIVCGDFNDTVGSYALYRLQQECSLRQAYPEVGFGPMLTYDAHNFMFRIDHILYRGDIAPYSMTRGSIKASDHYPVIATFVTGQDTIK